MIRKTSDRLYRRGYDGDMFIATYESDREIGHSEAGDLMRKTYSSDETAWVLYCKSFSLQIVVKVLY